MFFFKNYFCGGGGGVVNMEEVSTKNKTTTRPDPKDIVKEYINVFTQCNGGKYAEQIMELQSHITKGTKSKEWSAILDKMAPLVAHELLSQLEALAPLGLIDTSSLRTSLLKVQQQEDKKGLAALKGKLTGLLNNGQEEFRAKLKKHAEEALKHGEGAERRSDCYRELMKQTKTLEVKPESVASKEEMAHAAIFKGDLMARSTLNILKEWNSALLKEAGVDTGLDLETGSAAAAAAPRRKRAPKATATAAAGGSGGILPCDECGVETQKNYGSSGRIFCGTHFFREAILPRFKQLEETFYHVTETATPEVFPDDFPEMLEEVTGPFDAILIQNGLSDHSEFNDPVIIDQLVKALQDAEKKLQLLPPPKDKSEEESFDVPERAPLLIAKEEVEENQVFETAAAPAVAATNMVEVLHSAVASPATPVVLAVAAGAATAPVSASPRTPPPREEETAHVPAAPVKPKRGRKRVEREQEATPPESVKQCKLDDAWREALEYAREQNKKGKGQMLLDLLCDDNVEQVLAMKRQDPLETQQWIVVTVHNQDVLLSELFATREEAKRHRQKVMVDTPYFSWHVKEVKKQ